MGCWGGDAIVCVSVSNIIECIMSSSCEEVMGSQ